MSAIATSDAILAGSTSEPAAAAYRMFYALAGLALLATVCGVGRHLAESLAALMPGHGTTAVRLAAVPASAWLFAVAHLVAAVASLAVGYLVISLAYPRRFLEREARANPAAAIQASAHLLGAAVIAIVSWGGCDAPSLVVSLVFCVLGWVAVIVIGAAHRLVTRYRDHEEIAAGNTAAALAAAGLHLAVALVVGHAIQGQFAGWGQAFSGFAAALVVVFGLYPLRQVVLARLILRMSPSAMDAAVAGQRDHYLGAAEAACYVLTALCLTAGW
ncbi:MAG: DUF350 domain-containing protein [Planctomycetes bacterium]|nr:DUF350 domain-containing protein [Planctomycetota bacterium]